MQKPVTLSLTDWEIDASSERMDFRPSAVTIGKQLVVTGVCVLLMVVLALSFGFPPGSKKVARQQDRVEQAERQLKHARKEAGRARPSIVDMNTNRRDRLNERVTYLEQDLARKQAKLDATRATLGPVGDTAYWLGVAVLLLIGIGVPVSCFFERVALIYDPLGGPRRGGALRVQTRWSFMRSQSFATDRFVAQAVHAQRVARRDHEHGRLEDFGWLWVVHLVTDPQDPSVRGLSIRIDQEPTLPIRPEELTERTRLLVRFFEKVTGLPPQPPITTDVVDIKRRLFGGDTYKLRTRRHGS